MEEKYRPPYEAIKDNTVKKVETERNIKHEESKLPKTIADLALADKAHIAKIDETFETVKVVEAAKVAGAGKAADAVKAVEDAKAAEAMKIGEVGQFMCVKLMHIKVLKM